MTEEKFAGQMRPKEGLVALTGDAVAAVVLDLFMGWSYWSLWVGDPEIPVRASQGWVERSLTDLKGDLEIKSSDFEIQDRLDWLVQVGFLEDRLSDSGERQYRANVYAVQRGVFECGFLDESDRYFPLWWQGEMPCFEEVPNDLYVLTLNERMACLLEFYLYWSYWSLWVNDPEIPIRANQGWVEMPLEDIQPYFSNQSVSGIRQRLDVLVQVGFLEVQHVGSDEPQYRAVPYAIKRGLLLIDQLDEPEYPPTWWYE